MLNKMGLNDALSYISYANPVPKILSTLGVVKKNVPVQEIIPPKPLWKLATPYVQIAALSGASAIFLNAYCSKKKCIIQDEKRKYAFETSNVYHFINTVPIFALPLCRRPYIPCIVLVLAQILYCGPRYYYAMSNQKQCLEFFRGTEEYLFMCGWLLMLLK